MMRICFGLFLSQSPILPIACTIRGHGQLRDGGTQKDMEGFLEIRALAWYNTGNFSNGEKGIYHESEVSRIGVRSGYVAYGGSL